MLCLLNLSFVVFFNIRIRIQSKMRRKFCILKKIDVRCFSLPNFVGPLWGNRCTYYLTVFISEKHIPGTYFEEHFIDIWGGADFGHYSPQSYTITPHNKSVNTITATCRGAFYIYIFLWSNCQWLGGRIVFTIPENVKTKKSLKIPKGLS